MMEGEGVEEGRIKQSITLFQSLSIKVRKTTVVQLVKKLFLP